MEKKYVYLSILDISEFLVRTNWEELSIKLASFVNTMVKRKPKNSKILNVN